MADQPAPPENVRLKLGDGSVIPCELTYQGEMDGLHRWQASAPVAVSRGGPLHVLCDVLPAKTTIAILFAEREP